MKLRTSPAMRDFDRVASSERDIFESCIVLRNLV